MRLFAFIFLATIIAPTANALSLHYQFLGAGKAELKFAQPNDTDYHLTLNARFLSKQQQNISKGLFDGNNLIPQYYEDDKRSIGDDILGERIFDPVSALWQIMLASHETCDGVSIRYFNGKNYHRIMLADMKMLTLEKKYKALNASAAFSCMLTYVNEKTGSQNHSTIIFLRVAPKSNQLASHPILYQFKNHRNIQFTLTDVTPQ